MCLKNLRFELHQLIVYSLKKCITVCVNLQAREYNMLKGEVANRSASIQQKIESLLRKQKADQDILDGKMQQFSDTKDKIKRKCLVKDEGSERYQKLLDRIE